MAGSFRSRIAVLAIAVLAAASTAVASASTFIVTCCRGTCSWFSDRFDWLVSRIKPAKPQHLVAPRVALLGAVQMMGRMVRRDRPLVSPRWRMCPSV